MDEKISVISAVFNLVKAGRVKIFKKCLESVHNQTYGNIEHLVIDGGSDDGTVKLLKKYQAKGWIKFISEPDHGIYDAMNKGALMATGDYLAFLNSDDYWFDRYGVEETVKCLQKSNADFSCAPSFTTVNDFPIQLCPTQISTFFLRMPFCHQTMFVKKSTFVKYGMYDAEHYKSAADYRMILKLCLNGCSGIFVNRIFTAYSHGGFSAVDAAASAKDCIQAQFEEFSQLCPGFTRRDAELAFQQHIIPSSLFEVIRTKVSPQIANSMDAIAKETLADGKLKITVAEYSRPVTPDDFDRFAPWIIYETSIRFFCIPVVKIIKRCCAFTIKFFGIPIWSVKNQ